MDNFFEMDGYQFEGYISDLFRNLGFEVEATNYSNDGGIDLIATYNKSIFSGKYIIQCKNWTGSVGQPEVRDLYGVVMDQRANKGILITPSDYTQQAYDFAKGKNIELINGTILRTLISGNSVLENGNTSTNGLAFRDDRYLYYQKNIAEESNVASHYVQMIEYLRSSVKVQDDKKCTIELFEDIIRWADQLITRCYKAPSKASDKQMIQMLQAEAYIHIGKLAEATEILLKCNQFWIRSNYGIYSPGSDGITHVQCFFIIPWNLYVAFKRVNYSRGCDLLISKVTYPPKEPSYLGKRFVYPKVRFAYKGTGKTKHIDITAFCADESRDPSFFIDRFYKKTSEDYAKEIDAVLKLHGIL